MSHPDTLLARILKARYFPSGTFLTAALGHNPSYSWRSLHSTQDLLKLGSRWRIGDGASIGAWGEPWLRSNPPQCLTMPMDPNMNSMTVKDLIQPNVKVWNSPLISTLFPTNIAKLILDTPLIESCQEDALIRNPSSDGNYSVRSAYKLCQGANQNEVHIGQLYNWNLIWWKSHPRCAVSFGGCARTVSPRESGFVTKVFPVRLFVQCVMGNYKLLGMP